MRARVSLRAVCPRLLCWAVVLRYAEEECKKDRRARAFDGDSRQKNNKRVQRGCTYVYSLASKCNPVDLISLLDLENNLNASKSAPLMRARKYHISGGGYFWRAVLLLVVVFMWCTPLWVGRGRAVAECSKGHTHTRVDTFPRLRMYAKEKQHCASSLAFRTRVERRREYQPPHTIYK